MTRIDIISGFLGAGKTTLIKKLISEAYKGEKVVLIENEFGEIGIDGGFLKDAGIEITEMNSGCICCSLVGDFGKALCKVIAELSLLQNTVIATGGGAILRQENVDALRRNGRIYFLDRDIEYLVTTKDRPLSSDREKLRQRYNERYDIYLAAADKQIKAGDDAQQNAEIIK